MAEPFEVRVKVISQKGTCAAEHKVGDEWIIGSKSPEGICLSALHSMFMYSRVLRLGASFPWSDDPDAATLACADAENPVVFELRRIRK